MTSTVADDRRWYQPAIASDDIQIDPEFAGMIPPPSVGELAGLHRSLDAEGCRDSLIVWKGENILVYGQNRISYCRKKSIPFSVVEREFADRQAVKEYIYEEQAKRRNLSVVAASYLRGKHYRELCHQGHKEPTSGHSDPKRTSERLAELYQVREKTIRRDGVFAVAVDSIVAHWGENEGNEVRDLLLSRDSGVKQGTIKALAKQEAEAQRRFIAALKANGKAPRKVGQTNGAFMTLPTEMNALALALVKKFGDGRIPDLIRRLSEASDNQGKEATGGENGVDEGEKDESEPASPNGRRRRGGKRGSRNNGREAVGAGMSSE